MNVGSSSGIPGVDSISAGINAREIGERDAPPQSHQARSAVEFLHVGPSHSRWRPFDLEEIFMALTPSTEVAHEVIPLSNGYSQALKGKLLK